MSEQNKANTASPRQRYQQPTLFGMELAPQPPRPPKGEKAKSRRRSQSGVALLMVLVLILLSTTLTIEMQYDTHIQLQMAANSRDAMRAEYLAKSAVGFTHLILAFNTQYQRLKNSAQVKRFIKFAPPQMQMVMNRLQLWRIAPIDSAVLKQLFTGGFGSRPPDPNKQQDKADQGKLYNFGDFTGRFSAKLSDESSKINLNRFRLSYADAQKLRVQLMHLFAAKKYDKLFENPRADGTRVTRAEQIAAFEDWVDRDNNVAGASGSDEDSKYRYQEKGYFSKNHYFTSLQEIRLVFGVDDLFYQTFAQYFTVFGNRSKINIQDASEDVLASLVTNYAVKYNGKTLKPAERLLIARDPGFQQFMKAMTMYRSYLGFNDLDTFINWCANPTVLPSTLYPGAQTQQFTAGTMPKVILNKIQLNNVADVAASTFRVDAVGQVGRVKRRITTVIYAEPSGRRLVYYWRMH